MKLLVDTNIVLRSFIWPERLTSAARDILESRENDVFYSVINLWEVAIKRGIGRSSFNVDATLLHRELAENGWEELPVLARHVLAVETLPPIHRDPFDRLLLAQAQTEGMLLLTSDATLGSYPGLVKKI